MVSVQVTARINDLFSCSLPLLSLAVEENGVTVTHIRSATPGKRKMKAR